MRAVGYVAPRNSQGDSADTPDQDRVSWSALVKPTAGSWGSVASSRTSSESLPDDPAERIVVHSAQDGHNLVAIFGIPDGALSLMEQLDLPTHVADIDSSDSSVESSDEAQFEDLLSVLTPPAGHPALVLIHDARHLANDVESLVRRLLRIRATGSDARCTDPDVPDPLLSGMSMLPLTPEDCDAAADSDADESNESAAQAANAVRAAVSKIRQLASGGKVLGRTPYGYRASRDGTLEPVPHEAQVVRRVFGWYIGSDGREPVGMRTIVQRLSGEGAVTRAGKAWSTAAISGMLKNRAYVGTYSRYGFMVPGNHAPIIDRAVFNAAQSRMRQPPRRSSLVPVPDEPPFLLSGLVRCANCGHSIPGLTRKRTWRRKDDSVATNTYRYYEFAECPTRRNTRASGDEAKYTNGQDDAGYGVECPSWRADDLDALVRQQISELTADALDAIMPRDAEGDLDSQFAEARGDFAAALQQIALGKGDLEHLTPELDALSEVRAKIRVREESGRRARMTQTQQRRIVRDHVANLAADIDVVDSRESLIAIVDHVAVTGDDVDVVVRTD